jgi:allantoinase
MTLMVLHPSASPDPRATAGPAGGLSVEFTEQSHGVDHPEICRFKDGAVTVDLVIRDALIPDEAGGSYADVVVDAGRISAICPPGAGGSSRRIIHADGLTILPGAIDAHVHFDEPGRDEWEGWATGSLAAAAGGVTTVIDMPIDSHPPTTDASTVREKVALAQASSLVDFALWGGLVPDNVGALGPLLQSGVAGLKAFMCGSGWEDFPACGSEVLSRGMLAARQAGLPVAVHCEEPSLFGPGERDRPVASVAAVAVAAATAEKVGARLHVVHCSSADAVTEAKRWPRTTVETCPHYLTLTGEDELRIGADAVCCPPLRDEDNRRRLWQAVRDGMIDTIASDHSPCPPGRKAGPDPFAGISGVQTTLSILLGSNQLTLVEINRLRTAAARLFGLKCKGALGVGFDADLVLIDPEATWIVSAHTLHTRHTGSPFLGSRLRGVVVATLVRGSLVYQSGHQAAEPSGSFITPDRTSGPLPRECPS